MAGYINMIPITVPNWKTVSVMKVLLLCILIKGEKIMAIWTWFMFMLRQIFIATPLTGTFCYPGGAPYCSARPGHGRQVGSRMTKL